MFGSDRPVSTLVIPYRQTLAIVRDNSDALACTALRTYGLELA